ncbi:hypothetical protein NQD34_013474 [Periophthalmus magnuspinnatus]|nr:hypothetical protein NQD34_013474 [Periophthalmus magnuspinnatus]
MPPPPLSLILALSSLSSVLLPLSCIRINPDKATFLPYESVSLHCDDQNSATFWKVKRSTRSMGVRPCLFGWGSVEPGRPCVIKNIYSSDIGTYWCESEEGERSASVNITIRGNLTTGPGPTGSEPDQDPVIVTDLAPSLSPSVLRVLCHVVVSAPYLVSTVLLGLIYRDRRIAAQTSSKQRGRHDVIMEIQV